MATLVKPQSSFLKDEVQRLQTELLARQKELNLIQHSELSKIIDDFVEKVTDFDRVEVKKAVLEKLTRKHKKAA